MNKQQILADAKRKSSSSNPILICIISIMGIAFALLIIQIIAYNQPSHTAEGLYIDIDARWMTLFTEHYKTILLCYTVSCVIIIYLALYTKSAKNRGIRETLEEDVEKIKESIVDLSKSVPSQHNEDEKHYIHVIKEKANELLLIEECIKEYE